MPSSTKFLALATCSLLAACGGEESADNAAQGSVETAAPAEVAAVESMTPELGSFGIDLSYQDLNTRPGDDFFPLH